MTDTNVKSVMERQNENFKGFHKFRADDGTEYGSFEVFYNEANPKYAYDLLSENDGWFWWACHPGCIQESDPEGPFPTAEGAYLDAMEETKTVVPGTDIETDGMGNPIDGGGWFIDTALDEGTRYERAFGDGNDVGG